MTPRIIKLLAVGIVLCCLAGIYTWREGNRFVARPLTEGERLLVSSSLELGSSLVDRSELRELRVLLESGLIMAMDEPSFARREERITMGYTNELGVIMLNPRICFASHHTLGPEQPTLEDQIKTLSTLFHEFQHRSDNSPESEAYEREWLFLKACIEAAQDTELTAQLVLWEAEMSERVRLYVGSTRWERLKETLH